MIKNCEVVMSPTTKGSMVNVVPTKENVDYNKIYVFTKDPHFGRFNADRNLDKAHVSKIQKQILNGEYGSKFIAPIRVDINTLNTSDGKHRYNAFIRAWNEGSKEEMRVIFEDLPKKERDAVDVIIKINSTQKNWGVPAYNNRLIAEGNENMLNIKEFGMTHPLCQKKNRKGEVIDFYPRYACAIILGRNATSDVKNGTIRVSKEDIEFAEKINSELEQLVKALGYETNSWFESFAFAWHDIRKNDEAYNAIINEVGMKALCDNIGKFFTGLHPVTRKSDWDKRFRTAIWGVKNCC